MILWGHANVKAKRKPWEQRIMFSFLKRSLFHILKLLQLEGSLQSQSEERRWPPGRGVNSDGIVTMSASGNITECKRNLFIWLSPQLTYSHWSHHMQLNFNLGFQVVSLKGLKTKHFDATPNEKLLCIQKSKTYRLLGYNKRTFFGGTFK